MRALILIAAGIALFAGAAAEADAKTRPALERMPRAGDRPFSEGVRVGDMLYLSGQIGTLPDGTLPAGLEAQTNAVMTRIGGSLKKAGLGWKDVTRCLVMLQDMKDWPAFNTIYATYVDPANLPARSAFGATGLAMGALLEVQCDAYAPVRP